MPHARDQRELGGAVDLEALEVARVDPDHLGLEPDRSLKLVRVVRLHERLDSELVRIGHQGGGTLVVQVAKEDEHRVRSCDLRLQEIQLLGEKALREERRRRRRARGSQVVERAAEPLVHEDRDGCSAGFLELRGQVGRDRHRVGGRPRRASAV